MDSIDKLNEKIKSLEYEVSLLDREDATGVKIRLDELKDFVETFSEIQ